MVLKDVHILFPGTCKRYFTDMITLSIWRPETLSDLGHCLHKGTYKRKSGGSESVLEDEMMKARCWTDVRKGLPPKECKWPLETGKSKETEDPLRAAQGPSPTDSLTSVQ
jgi:hypothetical protein